MKNKKDFRKVTRLRDVFALLLMGLVFHAWGCKTNAVRTDGAIGLDGTWRFAIDSSDRGVDDRWYETELDDQVKLPGSMTTNGKGFEVSINTPWTGSIMDSTWFTDDAYAPYRQPGNIKIPYWLQPDKYYKGAAWYQREITIPDTGFEGGAELFLERAHWETRVWIDGNEVGMRNSLGTPHRFDISRYATPGKHTLSIRVDNRVKDINVGINSHSISDHTQSNWNGLVGELAIYPLRATAITDMQLFPDIDAHQVKAKLHIRHGGTGGAPATVKVSAIEKGTGKRLATVEQAVVLAGDTTAVEVAYDMGDDFTMWDEFNPFLYEMEAVLVTEGTAETAVYAPFGMRNIAVVDGQIQVNGRPVFFRGTLESCIFPETGYPPTAVAEWAHIFTTIKDYGLNHVRFHSWCPPEAAFLAADSLGVYLQVESSSWANQGATLGDGKPLDDYIYEETRRMLQAYGNHPSFVLMAYGNEPSGKNHVAFLTEYVKHWRAQDGRRLYTTAAGWPAIPENDFNNIPDPRIQGWGEGLNSIINGQPPATDYDWREDIARYTIPTISHEIGQWCVYPDFKEIDRYTGVMKAKNFEIFRDRLNTNGMGDLAEDFLMASGKLQVLCYKADIEAAFRTPGFGGFQLLDLHDFPGQGTALVGVLNPFWEEKGYVDGAEFSQFTNATVPLARFPKMVYLNSERLEVPVEAAHYGKAPITGADASWRIVDAEGDTVASGAFGSIDLPFGNNIPVGEVSWTLETVEAAAQLTLEVSIANYRNQWDFFVYPDEKYRYDEGIYITDRLDGKATALLAEGGSVLLSLRKSTLRKEKGGEVAVGFSSIFWNTAWTRGQPPHTLGILCDPEHPALRAFPTEYHSNWQWWDAMTYSNAINLQAVDQRLQPIVRVIDDWVTARPLALAFECNIGKGRLMVTGIDFH
ncbi:sugar-binding domain-containing protein, partial [Parapedobacter sp.]